MTTGGRQYEFALGWGVSEANLVRVNPQPQSGIILPAVIDGAVSLKKTPNGGFYTNWRYKVAPKVDFRVTRMNFGLTDLIPSQKCTIKTKTNNGYWRIYNATISLEIGKDAAKDIAFWHGVSYLLELE